SLSRQQAREAIQALLEDGQAQILGEAALADKVSAPLPTSGFLITRSGWSALRERLEALLSGYHREFPLRAGIPREEVKSRLARQMPGLSPRLFNEIVDRAGREGWLAEAGTASDRLRLASHQVRFDPKQQQAVDALLRDFGRSPYTTPSVAQSEERVGEEVLSALMEQGVLVKLSDDVIFLTKTYEEMRDRIMAYLKQHDKITVAEVRDMFDTSRKYALALLGYMDEKRITRRVGDERVLR
ncbi:MAG: SelB C-terminal domain-containing protein, partial [Anaerolineae bacterium]